MITAIEASLTSALAAAITSITYYLLGLAKRGEPGKEVQVIDPFAKLAISFVVGAFLSTLIVISINWFRRRPQKNV